MPLLQQSLTKRIHSMPLYRSSANPFTVKPSLPTGTHRTFSWWWNRVPAESSLNLDEGFHRHILRKQRILRYKYSKALRRRQQWDRDPLHNAFRPTWRWQIPGLCGTNHEQTLSSKSSPSEFDSNPSTRKQDTFDDFAHFKACVDRDPFGAVFGRRLGVPQKPLDASWSSFSWIFDSASQDKDPTVPRKSAISNIPPTSRPSGVDSFSTRVASRSSVTPTDDNGHQSTSGSSALATAPDGADQTGEYEFDPISMRKVIRSKPTSTTSAEASRPLFDPLFEEKSMDVPAKHYKPHREFGNSMLSSLNGSHSNAPSLGSPTCKPKPETSRLAEFRKMKVSTLGNSIDTTAEFHGKWVPETDKSEAVVMNERAVEPSGEEAPLFSGTIYEAKSKDILERVKRPEQDGLSREGLGLNHEQPVISTQAGNTPTAKTAQKQSSEKLQPSLDRLRSPQTLDNVDPSLSRSKTSSKETGPSYSAPDSVPVPYELQDAYKEDLDLLRASDIRAHAGNLRRTRQDSGKNKDDQREKLEGNFQSQQKNDDSLSVVFPTTIVESSKKLSKSFNNLWHRAQAQQKDWLAHKVKSLSNLHDLATWQQPESVSHKKDEVPVSEFKTASDVQKPATKPMQTFAPSQEVTEAEQESTNRTLALRNATIEATKVEAELREKEKALAQTIKTTYENEYGPITVHHRQVKGLPQIDQSAEAINEAKIRAHDNTVKNLIAQVEGALKHAKRIHSEVTQKFKAVRARLKSLSSLPPPPSQRITSDLPSLHPGCQDEVASENSTKKPAVEAKRTSSASPEPSASRTPQLYKVLAYDSSTLQVNIAETTSSMSANGVGDTQPLHPAEVLSRLNNVAKFLPYFGDMEKQGYEIVSGSGDVLVLKQVRAPACSSAASAKSSDALTEDPPTSSSPSPQEASPAESAVESIAANASSSKVRRQEDVFSGSGQSWHQEEPGSGSNSSKAAGEPGRVRRAIKRAFLGGTLTAAMAYVIGVFVEHAAAQGQENAPRRSGRPGIYSTEDSR